MAGPLAEADEIYERIKRGETRGHTAQEMIDHLHWKSLMDSVAEAAESRKK
jgi:hypothetical protein